MKDNAVLSVPIINPTKVGANKKGNVEPPANDFASQLAALKNKFN